MALKGNLRDFTVTQILNLINLARKSGTLIVEGSGQQVWISFREGKLAYARAGQEDNSLAAILYRAHKLNSAQHRLIRERAGGMNDKELGLLLINANYIDQQDILAILQSYCVEIVNRLFTWAEGVFRFESELMPPDGMITVRVGLENLIIDGARRLRELEQLQDEIPSLDMALKFVDRPGANIRSVNLSQVEWKVVSYINPKNSIAQIAQATHLNEVEIRRIVYGLLQAGLIEIIRPAGRPGLGLPGRAGGGRPPEPRPPGRGGNTFDAAPAYSAAAGQPGAGRAAPAGGRDALVETRRAAPVERQAASGERRAATPTPTTPRPGQPPQSKEQRKGLINRLIDRIRSL